MRFLILCTLFFLIGCNERAPEIPDTSSASSASSAMPGEEVSLEEKKGRYYEDYSAPNGAEVLASEVLGNGERSLLFFHAAGCASCTDTDALLNALYTAEGFPLSTYKIDFAASQDLRTRFGVTAEGTLLLVDGEGRALQAVPRASEMDLRYLLQR